MDIKSSAFCLAAALLLISCSNETGTIGSSITPAEDLLIERSHTYYATSRSIIADNGLLSRNDICYLGRYTDPETGAFTDASYLTQFNCVENYAFPDSVYGLEQFHFPDSLQLADGEKAFSTTLKLYLTELPGDALNAIKLEIWPLASSPDPNVYYTPDTDPTQFYDTASEPWASLTVSPTDFVVSDSIRTLKDYYNNILLQLPDSIAEKAIRAYFSENGKEKFANTPAFIENICKGCYIRCIQGDGTLLSIDQSVLELHFKHLTKDKKTGKMQIQSSFAEFAGNNEVLQINFIRNRGMENLLNDASKTYLLAPYGILTEIALPIDEMSDSATMVNSASMTLYRENPASQYNLGAPTTILMIRKSMLYDFFKSTNSTDNISSFFATFDTKYNEYHFSNISRLILKCMTDRSEWLEQNGWDSEDRQGWKAYAQAFPDWDKVVLVPVTGQTDANANVMYFNLSVKPSYARLKGGPEGEKIAIKTIKATF